MKRQKQFAVRFRPEVTSMIQQLASRDGMSETDVVRRIVESFFEEHVGQNKTIPHLSESAKLLSELKAYSRTMMAAWGYYYQTTGGPDAKKEYETWRKDFYRKVGLQLGGQKNE